MMEWPRLIDVVDSHTEGEPTRVVVAGWPLPSGGTMIERRAALLATQDHLRRAVVLEPRGHDAIVGALLTPPVETDSAAGVIFFNNSGALWMCGHGLIGVVRTLEFLGRIGNGTVRVDTPAGTVGATLEPDGSVTVENVAARAFALDVTVDVPGIGAVTGDVAYGGNWFFLTELPDERVALDNVRRLTDVTVAIRGALVREGIAGERGEEIDHVELFAPSGHDGAGSRNFVLCPGEEYDRSPCGTGTSAKMAVLHARGKLALQQIWRQESITGTEFSGWLAERDGVLIPYIRGRAHVTARSELIFDPGDPFREGFSARTGHPCG